MVHSIHEDSSSEVRELEPQPEPEPKLVRLVKVS